MDFFRRQDIMQGVCLTTATLPSGTYQALKGALTHDRTFNEPEQDDTAYMRLRFWAADLAAVPKFGEIVTVEGVEYRITSVRRHVDFVVIEAEAKYAR